MLTLILNILFLINNSLDEKYLISPFVTGDDILELKRITNQKLEDTNSIILINLGLFLSYIFVSWFNKKR